MAKPVTAGKPNRFDGFRLFGKQIRFASHIDAWLSIALFAISLAVFSFHWVPLLPTINLDASRLGLHAHDLLQHNIFPVYAYHLFAPSPLIIYLQAVVFAAIGYSVAALQGVTVVAGALTVPATYWACRWAFADQGAGFARRAGLIAALGLALSTLFASRAHLGTSPALFPVMLVTTVALLWRGLRRGSRLDLVLAGILVGVSQYAYLAARLVPVALAIACACAILANRRLLAHWRDLLLAAAVSALVALPQWLFFAAYPYTFSARVTEAHKTYGGRFVFELPDPVAVVAAKLVVHLTTMGSPWFTESDSGFKAILTPVLVVGLAVGVAAAVRQRQDGQLFAFLMMAMMLLPDLLTYEWHDHTAIDFSRLLPAIPFLFIAAGSGAAAIWTWMENRPRFPPWTGYLVLALVLVFGLFRQWDYTTRVQPNILDKRGAGLMYGQIAKFIDNHLDTPILLPTGHYADPRLALPLMQQFPQRQGGLEKTIGAGERVTVILPVLYGSDGNGLAQE